MQMSDLRNALRTLLHSPGFTFLAALLLAVGIGANALIYGALDAILLRTLPARHPEQLVRMVQDMPRIGRRSSLPYSLYRNLNAALHHAFHRIRRGGNGSVDGESGSRRSDPGASADSRVFRRAGCTGRCWDER